MVVNNVSMTYRIKLEFCCDFSRMLLSLVGESKRLSRPK